MTAIAPEPHRASFPALLLAEAADHLRAVTGIDLPPYRLHVLATALAALAPGAQALARLRGEPAALAEVVHAVTVPETYLFRHPGHFRALAELAAERRDQGRDCRVLSAGCATGEEVWSAAAVLADVYRPSRRFAVEGWDLDGRRTAQAAQGKVRDWGARAGLGLYGRYFRRVAGGFEVLPELRPAVSFREVNLAATILPPGPPYDAIFFRNVAIYWEAGCTRRVVERLVASLAPDGLLLLGPSDPVDLCRRRFRCSMVDNVLVHRGRLAEPAAERAKPPCRVEESRRRDRPLRAAPAPPAKPPSSGLEKDAKNWASQLQEAERLADAGLYHEALAKLSGRVPVRGRVLAGILLLNLDRPAEATERFRQAIFLEPQVVDHHHWLALSLEAQGHAAAAAQAREVAQELTR